MRFLYNDLRRADSFGSHLAGRGLLDIELRPAPSSTPLARDRVESVGHVRVGCIGCHVRQSALAAHVSSRNGRISPELSSKPGEQLVLKIG